MKKAIFFDVDGTLIDNSCGLPESAVYAIRRARENGHLCFLCTGRPYGIVPDPVLEIGFDGAVCGSGCLVRAGDEYILEKYLDVELVKGFTALLQAMELPYNYEAQNKAYLEPKMARINKQHQDESLLGKDYGRQWVDRHEKFKWVNNIDEYDFSIPITKICFRSTQKELEEVRRKADGRLKLNTHDGEYLGMRNTEVISSDYDKGDGVKMILEHFGIDAADSIGFGDSMNDISLMSVVGLSVCMGNGAAPLKERCDRVCEAVSEDGIKLEIERLGLI